MDKIPDGSVDMVLADIPYDCVNRESSGIRVFDKGKADIKTFSISNMMDGVFRVCSGSIYIFCGYQQVSEINSRMRSEGLSTRLIVWEKTNPTPVNGQHLWLSGIEIAAFGRRPKSIFNGHCKNTVLKYPSGKSKLHPTEKPIDLFRELVEVSTNPGDTVLDFTMGSGTTGVAAKQTGRDFIGIEMDAEYFKIAEDRINGVLV